MTRLRALLMLGVLGGVAGGFGAAIWATAQRVFGLGFASWADVIGLAQGGTIFGAAGAVGVGAMLATLEARSSLEELSLPRMGLLGAAVGVALPTLFLLVTSGTVHFTGAPRIVFNVVGAGAVLGAAFSTSLVAVAQRAQRAELAAVDQVRALPEAE